MHTLESSGALTRAFDSLKQLTHQRPQPTTRRPPYTADYTYIHQTADKPEHTTLEHKPQHTA